jgi:hypothetical protein
MRTYRFYFCNATGHIVRAQNIPCENGEAKELATEFLGHLDPKIEAVEVWEAEHHLFRVARHVAANRTGSLARWAPSRRLKRGAAN